MHDTRVHIGFAAVVLAICATATAQQSNTEVNRKIYDAAKGGILELQALTVKNLADWHKGLADCPNHMPASRCADALKVSTDLEAKCKADSDKVVGQALKDLAAIDLNSEPETASAQMIGIAKNVGTQLQSLWDKFRFQMQGMASIKLQEVKDRNSNNAPSKTNGSKSSTVAQAPGYMGNTLGETLDQWLGVVKLDATDICDKADDNAIDALHKYDYLSLRMRLENLPVNPTFERASVKGFCIAVTRVRTGAEAIFHLGWLMPVDARVKMLGDYALSVWYRFAEDGKLYGIEIDDIKNIGAFREQRDFLTEKYGTPKETPEVYQNGFGAKFERMVCVWYPRVSGDNHLYSIELSDRIPNDKDSAVSVKIMEMETYARILKKATPHTTPNPYQ